MCYLTLIPKKKEVRQEFLVHVGKMMDSSYSVELVKSCPHNCRHKNVGNPVEVGNSVMIHCHWCDVVVMCVSGALGMVVWSGTKLSE